MNRHLGSCSDTTSSLVLASSIQVYCFDLSRWLLFDYKSSGDGLRGTILVLIVAVRERKL